MTKQRMLRALNWCKDFQKQPNLSQTIEKAA